MNECNVPFLINVLTSLRISRPWSNNSCLTGFRSLLCSLSWMRHDTVTMTARVTPPRSLGMPWTLLSKVCGAKSKRSVRLYIYIGQDGFGCLLVLVGFTYCIIKLKLYT